MSISILQSHPIIPSMVRKETQASNSIPKTFPLTETIWRSMGKNKSQSLFFVIFILMCPFLFLFLKEFNSIYQMRIANNPTYLWPQYSDLLLALASAGIIIVIYTGITKILTRGCMGLISNRYQGGERVDRAEKMAKNVFKATYFAVAAVAAYLLSKDSFYLPSSLGGKGDVEKTFEGLPYYDQSSFVHLREYFMVQLGYHFSALVLLFIGKMRSDFMEMLLHHSITVFLLSLSYLMNYWPISLMILYVHDISDVFVCLTRVFVDTSQAAITFIIYICLLVTWIYTRLFVFPFELIRVSCYQNPWIHEVYGIGILGGMAHILLLLHVYWFYLLVQMGIRFLKTAKPQDTQNDLREKQE
jgi:hypothetical protein